MLPTEPNRTTRYIISPDNDIAGVWDALILLFVIYTAITLPYAVAFLGDSVKHPGTTVLDTGFFLLSLLRQT